MAKSYQSKELHGIVKINPERCKGCDSCKSFCPVNAIDGPYGATHHIDDSKCLQCAQCLVNCPFGAIEDTVDVVDTVIQKLQDKNTTVVARRRIWHGTRFTCNRANVRRTKSSRL